MLVGTRQPSRYCHAAAAAMLISPVSLFSPRYGIHDAAMLPCYCCLFSFIAIDSAENKSRDIDQPYPRCYVNILPAVELTHAARRERLPDATDARSRYDSLLLQHALLLLRVLLEAHAPARVTRGTRYTVRVC